jgi:hypothetical protein
MDILKSLIRLKKKWDVCTDSPQANLDLDTACRASVIAELEPLLSNRSGYVREAAVHRAAELLLPTALPLLIPRVNDWVPQVREAAIKAVEAYLLADQFDALLNALPFIYRLKDCGREDHADFIKKIEKFIVEHRRAYEIPKNLTKYKSVHARSLFNLSWEYDLATRPDLIRIGLTLHDTLTVRRSCRAIEQIPASEQVAFGKRLLNRKSGWLRFEGLKVIAKHTPSDAKQAALACLLAEYAPLRELAVKLSERSPDELSLLRQETLHNTTTSNDSIRTAIKLCGTLKDRNCIDLLEGFLEHRYPTFRGYALLALCRISPGVYNKKILAFLCDEASVVSRCAVQAFVEGGLTLTPDQWEAYAQETQTDAHFQRMSSLARRTNKWEHFGLLLAYSAQGKFPDLVCGQLRAWLSQYNRSFIQVSQTQMCWIKANLQKYTGQSPSVDEIAFYLPVGGNSP